MKTLLLLLTFSSMTFASDGAGNGGGTWVCQNNDQLQTIRWVKLVDCKIKP